MTYSSHVPRRVAYAVGLLFCTLFATPAWAGIIYEFREIGSSIVLGTIEIESPPANAASGWSTTDPADVIALRLDDSVFGLGTGNLSTFAVSAALFSLDGSALDIGAVALSWTIIPVNPSNPTIDHFLSLQLGVPVGDDFIGLNTITMFPNNSVVFDDVSRFGDWTTAQVVPEPATAALVLIGLAAGRVARRRRR